MKSGQLPALLVLLLALTIPGSASDQKSSTEPPKMTKQTRMDLVRAFMAELVYVRTPFPMGNKGLTVKDGVVTPSGEDLQQMIAMWGPAAKPGDQARITDIRIKDDIIHFEINGGPVKKKKWYQRIEVGGMGGMTPVAPSDPNANPRGSFVNLKFDHYVPEIGPKELKDLLRPVFDFNAKSAVEAYLDTVPPKVKEAIKNHNVLVGMNREMVTYAKGRPPKKIREKTGDVEYEEWIYGEPPAEVDFVRFVGDEVIRVENMKVDGEKTVRTEREIQLEPAPSVAKTSDEPDIRPADAPSLRRPGEAADPNAPKSPGINPTRPVDPAGGTPPQPGSPGPYTSM